MGAAADASSGTVDYRLGYVRRCPALVKQETSGFLGSVMSEEVISEERRQEAARQLAEVCATGKRFTKEFDEGTLTMNVLAGKIREKDIEAASLRARIEELEAPGEGFASNDPIPSKTMIKIDQLRQQLNSVIEERRNLKAIHEQLRFRLIKVARSIEELMYAQRNLEAIAKGENPASGPVGGVYRVSVGGYQKVL